MIHRRLAALVLLSALGRAPAAVAGDEPTEWTVARDRVAPIVVTVQVTDAEGASVEQGTGFVVAKGTVATSRHLFRRAAGAHVFLRDGTKIEATGVRAADPLNDLALLAVPMPGAPTIAWGESKGLVVGAPVAMIGTPKGAPQTFTSGTFVARKDALGVVGFLETTAEMDHGSSGGPLFDLQGRVVGLAAARLDWSAPSGLYVPVERLRALVEAVTVATEVRPFGTSATFLDAAEWSVQGSKEMRAATEAAAKDDLPGLVAAMKVVVAKHPKSALALFGLAGAQSRAGDDTAAVASLRSAVAIFPAYFEAATDLALALERTDRHAEAVEAFKKAIEIDSRYLVLWFGLGQALVGVQKYASAIAALERVAEAEPKRPDVLAWLGTAYARADRLDDARAVVARLKSMHPDFAARLAEEIEKAAK